MGYDRQTTPAPGRGRFRPGRRPPLKQMATETRQAFGNIRTVAVHCHLYRWYLLGLALLAALAAVPPLLTPWLAQILIDKAYPARNYHLLVGLGVGLLFLGILASIISTLSGYLSTYVRNHLQYRLSFRVVSALQRIPPSSREEHGAGGLLVRADRDVQVVAQSVTQLLPQIATLLVTFLAALGMMLRLHLGITLVVLAAVPAYYWIIGHLTSKLVTLSRATMATTDQITTFVGETIEGAEIARLFALNRLRRRTLRQLLRERLCFAFTSWRAGAFWGQLAVLVTKGWGAALLAGGWYLVFSDRLQLGQAVALGMYIGVLIQPFTQLGGLYQSLLMDSVAAGRVIEILRWNHGAPQPQPQKVLAAPPQKYELRGLSFGYQQGHACLHGIDLCLRAGQTVAVVGPTGGGKSTLMRILCGLEDRYSGQFLIDGYDLRDLDRDSYLRHVAWVPQTHFFFSVSVRDNLCPRNGSTTTDHLRHYAGALGLSTMIDSTPEGYDTRLGEKGIRLSVGQYQKLAVVRAMLKEPSVLLLDEAAASMDIESERKLLQGIIELRSPQCLTVLVTHHISVTTEPWIDEIVVLADGRIIERGSCAQLWEKGGFYHHWLSLSKVAFQESVSPL